MSAYDILAEYYDDDMGRNNPGHDIAFYRDRATKVGGRVLELGCGTGRIALPLVQSGATVVGLDNSYPMLRQLERKAAEQLTDEQRRRLTWSRQDIRGFQLDGGFQRILCPFATFNYLVEDADQARFFEAVRRHLEPDGQFVVDAFVPHHDVSARPDDEVYFDYRREIEPGIFLERRKTITKDLTRQVSRRKRWYRVLRADGSEIRSFVTEDCVRYCYFRELQLLLQLHGFAILETYGDYLGLPYRYEAEMMVFVTRSL